MEQCKGLIAGIDIGYSKIQASVYSYNSRNVQTVKLTEDSKEKTSLANVVAECMRARKVNFMLLVWHCLTTQVKE